MFNFGKTKTQIINEAITDVIFSSVANCTSSHDITQKNTFSGIGFLNFAFQKATLNAECLQDVRIDTQMAQNMAQSIIQAASTNAIALVGIYNESNAQTELANYLSTKLSNQNLLECYDQTKMRQENVWRGIQIGTAAVQTLDTYKKCMHETLNKLQVAQDIIADIENNSSVVTVNPLQVFADALQSMAFIWIAIIGLIIFILYKFGDAIMGALNVEVGPTGPKVSLKAPPPAEAKK